MSPADDTTRADADAQHARRTAALIGPTLVVVVLTENPVVNPTLYDSQIPPVVYLNGTLLFVAGLAVVRAHLGDFRGWATLVPATGLVAMAVGLLRMVAPQAHVAVVNPSDPWILTAQAGVLAVGTVLTVQGWCPR